MKRKLLCLLIALVMLWPSLCGFTLTAQAGPLDDVIIKQGQNDDTVVLLQMRLRDLGYYNYKITGFFGDFTKDALTAFQKQNGLSADSVAGAKTLDVLYGNDAKRKPVEARRIPTPPERAKNVPLGKMLDWFKYVNGAFPRGTTITIIDVRTGIQYNVTRVGGYNHADVEPATKKDTERYLKVYNNNTHDATRRPIVAKIKGQWIAASMYGEIHGYETVPNNNMNGQICLHFLNSKTHIHNMVDPDHQRCVRIAAGLE